jgi:hypothetical protein
MCRSSHCSFIILFHSLAGIESGAWDWEQGTMETGNWELEAGSERVGVGNGKMEGWRDGGTEGERESKE